MRRDFLLAAVGAVVALAPATSAFADDAATLFKAGRDAAKRGDYVTACSKLDQSYRLDPAPGTLMNLADCQEHLGRTSTAWQLFKQALQTLPKGDDRIAPARDRVTALEPRISHIEVTLSCDIAPPGACKVTNDGADFTSFGASVLTDPGLHVLVVSATGRADRRFEITVAEGQTARITVGPSAPTAVAAPQPTSHELGPVRVAGIVIAGVGVVGIGAAIGTGLVLPQYAKTVTAHCGPPAHDQNLCDATGFDAAQTGKRISTANTALWAVGLTAIGAGATLIVVGSVVHGKHETAALVPTPGGAVAMFGGEL